MADVMKSLSVEQQQTMEEFREYLSSLNFFEDFKLESNNFLLRYLQASSFNIEKAKVFINNYLDIHKKHNAKAIQVEEFPKDFAQKFLTYVGGRDKNNRPIAMIPHGGLWNIKEAIQQGREDMFIRYVLKVAMVFEKMVLERDADYGILVCDVSNVAYGNYFHKRTLEVLLELVNTVEKIAPGIIRKVYFVNAPKVWVAFFNTVRKLVTISAEIYAYDGNRDKWVSTLREFIPEDGICKEFGGAGKDFETI